MKDSLRNMTWIFVGIVMGSIVNLCLVSLGMVLIPPPAGLDLSDPEVLKDNIKLLPPKSFLFPWLAHALGTLIGAFLVARYAAMKPFVGATVIAAFFLNGGLMMVLSVGGPSGSSEPTSFWLIYRWPSSADLWGPSATSIT